MIIDRAYFYQDKTVNRKPQEVEKYGFICNHYMFGFGDKAVEIVKDYGVTVDFNDIKDNDSAYHWSFCELLIVPQFPPTIP